MVERISWKQFYWCGGRGRVILTVSTTYSRRTWHLYQVQYPTYIFFRDSNSFQLDMLLESRGWNILSSV